jgi:hypothetical protein
MKIQIKVNLDKDTLVWVQREARTRRWSLSQVVREIVRAKAKEASCAK